jgi:hypothetical protein
MTSLGANKQVSAAAVISVLCLLLLAIAAGLAQAPTPTGTPSAVEIIKKQIDALTQLKKNNELLLQEQQATLERLEKIEKTAAQVRLFAR